MLQRLARRTYGLSLVAYPAAFRNDLAEPMHEAFDDRCRAARAQGAATFVSMWGRGLLDSLVNGLAERFGG